MKPKPPIGYPATESIEEAITLLRRTPAATLLCSFLGGVPFWLALLYFVADMSRDAFAAERLAGASLTLAVLYLWKKCWQTVYAVRLAQSARRRGAAALDVPPRRPAHPHPGADAVLRPAHPADPLSRGYPRSAWVSAYYQNVTVLGDGRAEQPRSVSAQAWAQARLWPAQNHLLIAILGFFLLAVWLNVALTCAATPFLMKSFLGIETMATLNYRGVHL